LKEAIEPFESLLNGISEDDPAGASPEEVAMWIAFAKTLYTNDEAAGKMGEKERLNLFGEIAQNLPLFVLQLWCMQYPELAKINPDVYDKKDW
jgi:hypothetical protein